jgi:integrase
MSINPNWHKENAKWRNVDYALTMNKTCTDEDKNLIRQFIDYKIRIDHIREARVQCIVFDLFMVKRFLNTPFYQMSIDDALAALNAMKNGNTLEKKNQKSHKYSANTMVDVWATMKNFMNWLADEDAPEPRVHHPSLTESRIYKYMKKAPPGKDPTETIRPEEVLREREVLQMVTAADCQRNRTLLLVTYEAGCRIGETGAITWKDVIFERVGRDGNETETAKLYVTDSKSKSQKRRYIRLIMSVPDLIALKNLMKPKSDDEFVFLTDGVHEFTIGEPMSYRQCHRQFKYAGDAAHITKPVRPHCFRHSRATELIRQGYGEIAIKSMLWGNLNSKMYKVYVAVLEQDVDREVFDKAGIKTADAEVERVTPRPCPVCRSVNPFDAELCGKCGSPVSPEGIKAALEDKKRRHAEEEAYQKQSIIKLLNDPAVVSILKHKVNDTVIPVGIVDGDKLLPGTPRYSVSGAYDTKEEVDAALKAMSDDGKIHEPDVPWSTGTVYMTRKKKKVQ